MAERWTHDENHADALQRYAATQPQTIEHDEVVQVAPTLGDVR
jgi:hypothetical protein